MLRPETYGHGPMRQPQWRVILTRIRVQRTWDDEKETGEARQSHNGIDHSLEAMLHWRDPAASVREGRGRRKSLIDDNPSSG
jgi:hypothetical protein